MYITVVELPEFIKNSKKCLTDSERGELITYLSNNPRSGKLISGTGGIRKIRWAREGIGKRGGVRVIYFYYNEIMPLFILSVFAKNDKINLSKSERNELAHLVKHLVEKYKGNIER